MLFSSASRALALRHGLLSPHPGHLSPPLALASSSPKCRQAFFFTTRASEFFTAAARRILHRERQRTSLRRRSLRSFSVTSPPPLKLWRDKPAARGRRISPERQRRFRRFVRTDFTLPTARFRPTNPEPGMQRHRFRPCTMPTRPAPRPAVAPSEPLISSPLASASSSPKCRQAFFFTTRVSEFFTAAARRILHRERQRTSLRRR